MSWAFFYGFVTAIGVVAAFVAWAGRNSRPLLSARLQALANERKTILAKQVRASASVDKFKLTSFGTVKMQSTPAHIQSAGTSIRLTMIGGAVTITSLAPTVVSASAQGADASSPAAAANSNAAASKFSTTDKVIGTLNVKNVTAKLDKKNRCILYITPNANAEFLCEVDDRGLAETEDRRVKWRALTLSFVNSPREAERWASVLNANPSTARWIQFVKSIPQGADTCFNMFLARILFENSGDRTLDTFIAAKIRKKLAHLKLPKPLAGQIELLELHFGDEAPLFTNTVFGGSSSTGEFGLDFDLSYRGGFTLMLSVTVDVGPIKIPNVVLDVKIQELTGKVHYSVDAPPSNKMWIAFHEAPQLKIELHQDIHVPPEVAFLSAAIRSIDLSDVVSEIVKVKLFEDMILPCMDDLPIPNVGPTPPSTPEDVALRPVIQHETKISGWTDLDPTPAAPKPVVVAAPQPAVAVARPAGEQPPVNHPMQPPAATPPQKPATPMLLSKSPSRVPSDAVASRIIREANSAHQGSAAPAVAAPAPETKGTVTTAGAVSPFPEVGGDGDDAAAKADLVAKAARQANEKAAAILEARREAAADVIAASKPQHDAPAATGTQASTAAHHHGDEEWDVLPSEHATPTLHQAAPQPSTAPPAGAELPPPLNQRPSTTAGTAVAPLVDTQQYARRYVQSQPQW